MYTMELKEGKNWQGLNDQKKLYEIELGQYLLSVYCEPDTERKSNEVWPEL